MDFHSENGERSRLALTKLKSRISSNHSMIKDPVLRDQLSSEQKALYELMVRMFKKKSDQYFHILLKKGIDYYRFVNWEADDFEKEFGLDTQKSKATCELLKNNVIPWAIKLNCSLNTKM
jgi:DUF438 domain-containing protein